MKIQVHGTLLNLKTNIIQYKGVVIYMKKKLMVILMFAGLAAGCGGRTLSGEDIQTEEIAGSTIYEDSTSEENTGTESTTEVSTADEELSDFIIEETGNGHAAIKEYTGNESEVTVPDIVGECEITEVGGFINHTELTSVVIPDTVQEISTKAFINCYSLASVHIGQNVDVIGDYAFDGVFEEIALPEKLESIGKSAFRNIPLKNINIPENVSDIGESAFQATKLETVTIPGNVKTIKENTFKDCENLKEVTIESGVEKIEQAFGNCTSLNKIVIPASVIKIAFNTFSECPDLTIIAEPGSYAEEYATGQGISVQTQSN